MLVFFFLIIIYLYPSLFSEHRSKMKRIILATIQLRIYHCDFQRKLLRRGFDFVMENRYWQEWTLLSMD